MVLALGVATFGLIAVFSLFVVGLNTGKQSDSTTTLAMLSLEVSDQLRGGTNSTAHVATTFYFTKEGVSTNAAGAFYQCQVSTLNGPLAAGNVSSNFLCATMRFAWPAAAPAAAQTVTNVFATAPYRP